MNGNGLLTIRTLAVRELTRFFRQRTRVIGALGQPMIFWILFGAGLRGSFKPPDWASGGMTYQEYFYPGIAVMILLFTAIFSTISIIEDRREGFLQGVLASPAPRASIAFGKVAGGTSLAVLQAVAFLLIGPVLHFAGLAPTMGMSVTPVSAILLLGFLVLIGIGLTALGYILAWVMDSTQGYHAMMSVFLFPLWLLSGAFFPGGTDGWLRWVIAVNPLTYGVAGLRRLMYANTDLPTGDGLPGMTVCWIVTATFAVVCLAIAVIQTSKPHVRNAR